MNRDIFIKHGFKPIPHFTVADNLIYDLGRNRHLSVGCVGTPNEMIFLCQRDFKNPKKTTDLVCVHNWDHNGEITEEKLLLLINVLK